MAIDFTTEVDDGTLVVTSRGFDESPEQVQAYGMAVIDACVQAGVTRVLCDERKVEYRLNTVDTHAAASFIAKYAPRIARGAIVCNPAYIDDAQFWENVAANRGLPVRVFKHIDDAWAWLRDS